MECPATVIYLYGHENSRATQRDNSYIYLLLSSLNQSESDSVSRAYITVSPGDLGLVLSSRPTPKKSQHWIIEAALTTDN